MHEDVCARVQVCAGVGVGCRRASIFGTSWLGFFRVQEKGAILVLIKGARARYWVALVGLRAHATYQESCFRRL